MNNVTDMHINKLDRSFLSASLWLWAMVLAIAWSSNASAQDDVSTTYADLAPILATKCVMCHSGGAASAGLRLDSIDAILEGSQNGPVVEHGDPDNSELIRRLRGTSQPRMPLTGPPFLEESEIALFERWVAAGMPQGQETETPADLTPTRPAPGEPVNYAHVAPIFAARCVKCHAAKGLMGPAPEGYLLTSYQETMATDDRAQVVPGKPKASELVRRIRGQAHPRMPLDGPPYLSDEEIRLVEEWIAQGARNAEGVPASLPTGARVRLHGTLEARWVLDGLPLAVGSQTRIDKSPRAGNYVQVRGRVGKGGVIEVERIRRR